MKNPHACALKKGFYQHDTNGNSNHSGTGASNPNGPTNVAVLHHYRYKSRKEWVYRACARGRLHSTAKSKCTEDIGLLPSINSQVFDNAAWELLKQHVPKYGVFDTWLEK
jgi:hypothetical protein